jgi:hypothetical protein
LGSYIFPIEITSLNTYSFFLSRRTSSGTWRRRFP